MTSLAHVSTSRARGGGFQESPGPRCKPILPERPRPGQARGRTEAGRGPGPTSADTAPPPPPRGATPQGHQPHHTAEESQAQPPGANRNYISPLFSPGAKVRLSLPALAVRNNSSSPWQPWRAARRHSGAAHWAPFYSFSKAPRWLQPLPRLPPTGVGTLTAGRCYPSGGGLMAPHDGLPGRSVI